LATLSLSPFSVDYTTNTSGYDFRKGQGDLDAELEQFAMDLGGAPQRVLKAHSTDQVAYLSGDPRTASRRPGFPPPVGVRDDLLKFVLSDAVPALHKGRMAIKKARAELAERKSKLKIEGPDKTDVAGAFRRMEIRTRLHDMKPDELERYFARYGDNLPTEIAQAVTELPPEYSGVPQSRHDLLTGRALNAQFGNAITEINEIEQAIEAAESSVEAARDEVRLEVGIYDPAKFNELAAPIEAKHAAPWLRRRTNSNGAEEIRVVDLDRKVERVATPEEVERGMFYDSFEDYQKGKAA
jgi:hypothetical protein